MTNFQKLQHRKLENFRGQSRLLRRHLTTKLCNLGMCSKALEVDNDASFHLRLCLVDLDKVQGRRFKRSAMCQFDPPPYYRLTKKPILIRVNIRTYLLSFHSRLCCRCFRSQRVKSEIPSRKMQRKLRRRLADEEIGDEVFMPTSTIPIPIGKV